ncbi:MAG TPA: NAD(P)H-binding protein [Gemmatimonadales bacterium]
MLRVLVTGASGQLGRHVVAALEGAGHHARALTRARTFTAGGVAPSEVVTGDLTAPSTLARVCDDVDAVIACGGASMRLAGWRDRASFTEVDHLGNLNLLARASAAGVRRFVYVSLFGAHAVAHTEYARAHEAFVGELERAGIPHTVVRPTGYFSTFAEMLPLAARGRAAVVGDGSARTNPVHEADVASCCVAALESGAREVEIGGPDVLTRREIAALACEAVGRPVVIRSVSPGVVRAATAPLRLLNPRIHALVEFGTAVSLVDAVAPAVGGRSLHDHFAALGAHHQMGRRPPHAAIAA